jgi:hypothetical protein
MTSLAKITPSGPAGAFHRERLYKLVEESCSAPLYRSADYLAPVGRLKPPDASTPATFINYGTP